MNSAAAVTALNALAQSSRLAVFRHLVEREPDGAGPGEIANTLGIAPATLSFHLKTLQQAGLIEVERLGRHLRYRARIDAMQSLIGFLGDRCCDGRPELCMPAVIALPTPRKRTSP